MPLISPATRPARASRGLEAKKVAAPGAYLRVRQDFVVTNRIRRLIAHSLLSFEPDTFCIAMAGARAAVEAGSTRLTRTNGALNNATKHVASADPSGRNRASG